MLLREPRQLQDKSGRKAIGKDGETLRIEQKQTSSEGKVTATKGSFPETQAGAPVLGRLLVP